jgi:hypothetical protein
VRQPVRPGRDRAGAEADDDVARPRLFAHQPFEIVLGRDGARVAVAMGDQPRDQVVAAGALDRVLAGGEDLGDADHVGVVETGAEILEQEASRV